VGEGGTSLRESGYKKPKRSSGILAIAHSIVYWYISYFTQEKTMKNVFDLRLVAILLTLLFFFGCASTGDMMQTQEILERTLTLENGLRMRYTIALPNSLALDKPVPLVLALHYGGTVTPFYGRGFLTLLVEPALKDLSAIIVAPDCPGQGWVDPISEKAVLEVLENIKSYYKVDPNKIVVTGFSTGGVGTWYFAQRHTQLFSAAIPISAVPESKTFPAIKGIPIYAIHSRGDEVFPIDKVRSFVEKQKSEGASIHFEELVGISHYETYRFVNPLKQAIPWLKNVWGD
jgi:predicted peptidase